MTSTARSARQALAALLAITEILSLAACGGDEQTSSKPAAQVAGSSQAPAAVTTPGTGAATTGATTPPARTTPGTTTPRSATGDTTTSAQSDRPASANAKPKTEDEPSTAKRPKSERPAPAKGAAKPAPNPDGTPPNASASSTPLAPTAPSDTEPDPPGPNPPADCLREAGLTNVVKRQDRIWSGETAAGDRVFVDGPYGSEERARDSAKILREAQVNKAESAGLYQVTGGFKADIGSEIDAVVRCLWTMTKSAGA